MTRLTALSAFLLGVAPVRAQFDPEAVAARHERWLRSEIARVYAPSAYVGRWALEGRFARTGTEAFVAHDRLVLVGESGRCTVAPMEWVCDERAGVTCEGEPGYACLPSPLDAEHHVANGRVAFDGGTLDLELTGATPRPTSTAATAALRSIVVPWGVAARPIGVLDRDDGTSTITLRSASAWAAVETPRARWTGAVASALGPPDYADVDWAQEVLVLEWTVSVDSDGHVAVISRTTIAAGPHACRGWYRRRSPPYDDCNGHGSCRCVPLDGAATLVDW